jgi:hypothetical protein
MDFSNVTDEQLQAELDRRKQAKSTDRVGTLQNQQSPSFNGGIQNPADFDFEKMFVSQANKSKAGKGDKWLNYINQNVKTPEAKNYMYSVIDQYLKAHPNATPSVTKQLLRKAQAAVKAKYPTAVSDDFDISATGWGMWDGRMAQDVVDMYLSQNKPVVQTPNNTNTQNQNKPKPVPANPNLKTDKLRNAYMKIKNKQATDQDLLMFSDKTDDELKKIGFGPISIQAIRNARGKMSGNAERFIDERQRANANGIKPNVAGTDGKAYKEGAYSAQNGPDVSKAPKGNSATPESTTLTPSMSMAQLNATKSVPAYALAPATEQNSQKEKSNNKVSAEPTWKSDINPMVGNAGLVTKK